MLTETQPVVANVAGKARTVGNVAVSPAIAGVALAIGVIALAQARLRLDGYGLLHSLPWAYYLALAGLPLKMHFSLSYLAQRHGPWRGLLKMLQNNVTP